MKPKVGKTDSQEHIFYNMLSKVKLVSKTQLANGQIKEESNHLKNVIWERIFFFNGNWKDFEKSYNSV